MHASVPAPSPRRRARVTAVLLAVAALIAALLPAVTAESAASAEATAAASPLAPLQPQLVVDTNFPDPDLLVVDGVYHAYATNSGGQNVQHRTSTDLRTWTPQADAAPVLGSWVGECSFAPGGDTDYCVWAPEVSEVEGGYALYYTARDRASGRQCIGSAFATSPDGPFVDDSDAALVCPVDDGGAIDAGTFRDGDQLFLLWKSDGNCCSKPAILHLQPLSADGTELTGPATELLRNDLPWEGAVVEAPTMVKRGDAYYLFFSANDFGGGNYRTGWARASSPQGPWTVGSSELMTSEVFRGQVRGPGGQDVVRTRPGQYAIVFHGWDTAFTKRGMYAARLTFDAQGTPRVVGAAARYEAEDAQLTNARVRGDGAASSGEVVGGLDFDDSAITFTVQSATVGPQTLGIRFANGSVDAGAPSTSRHALTVNGRLAGSVDYWHTGWGNWQVLEVPVDLVAGSNTVTLTRTHLFAEIDVAYLTPKAVPAAAPVHPEPLAGATRYEAEAGTVTHAVVRSDPTASAGGAVGGLDFADSSVKVRVWAEQPGPFTLAIRFANGSERGGYPLQAKHNVLVNGSWAKQVTYPHTRWGNWTWVEHEVTLPKQGWNTVTLKRAAWYAELDAVDVRPASVG